MCDVDSYRERNKYGCCLNPVHSFELGLLITTHLSLSSLVFLAADSRRGTLLLVVHIFASSPLCSMVSSRSQTSYRLAKATFSNISPCVQVWSNLFFFCFVFFLYTPAPVVCKVVSDVCRRTGSGFDGLWFVWAVWASCSCYRLSPLSKQSYHRNGFTHSCSCLTRNEHFYCCVGLWSERQEELGLTLCRGRSSMQSVTRGRSVSRGQFWWSLSGVGEGRQLACQWMPLTGWGNDYSHNVCHSVTQVIDIM